jgi:peptidoglycan lytic transglycosylase G
MTEYGRGPGPEPWHPDDPLYGDQGWSGGYDPADDPAARTGSWEQQYGSQPPQEAQQPYYRQPAGHPTGWDATGEMYAADPYGQQHGGQPTGPYDTGEYPSPDAYSNAYGGPQDTYPAPQPQPQPQPHPRHHAEGLGPDPETGWDPGPDQGERDFFTRRDGDYDNDDADEPRGRRSERRGGAPAGRKRGRLGCLVLALVLVGGVGGAGYYGYQVYQDRFGPAPDYEGQGTGEVQVEIPQGASVSDMGNLLREADVVRSHDAFVEAAGADGPLIQAGIYTLRRQMSAESAVEMLLDPAAVNALTIPEGLRATDVYAAIDEQLGEPEGTTEDVAGTADLGLPQWAEGDVEGFLFPARYDVGEDTTPEELLGEMVDRAEQEFTDIDLEGQAQEIGQTPHEVLTVASLIQAEAQEPHDFGRVSRVIYNRLEQDMRLEFDSTINYAMGRSTVNTSVEDTQFDSPYNTYVEYGLPPGPIDNPGHQAIEAALNPTDGNWLYFVTVSEGDTRFTDDYDEHQQNVEDFNTAQQEGDG